MPRLPEPKASAFPDRHERERAGRFGMWLFLLTLAVVFIATIMAYVVVRLSPANAGQWRPADAPPLPRLLIASTFVLIVSDLTMHAARVAAARGRRSVGAWMIVTFLLAMAFVALQLVSWADAARANLVVDQSLYAWTFYVMTALHGVHVLGGILPMSVTTARALQGKYGPDRDNGLVLCAMYWHFLNGVWLFLYATLAWGSVK